MTSPTSAKLRLNARRRGFTLVELLIVMGIMLVLASILVPMVIKSYKTAQQTRMAADFQSISVALGAYKTDFGMYPEVGANEHGSATLVRALLAPDVPNPPFSVPAGTYDDGAPGYGFRIRRSAGVGQGKVFGPYLDKDKFQFKSDTVLGTPANPELGLVDTWGERVIMYYVARPGKVNVTDSANGAVFVGTLPISLFNPNQNNTSASGGISANMLSIMLGDTNKNGYIDNGEHAKVTEGFVLWSAGPDRVFGPTQNTADPASDYQQCDDVTNFTR
jgi:prepilin-type N-terminal cleavage/methylation domain-containing protein